MTGKTAPCGLYETRDGQGGSSLSSSAPFFFSSLHGSCENSEADEKVGNAENTAVLHLF